jgi:1-acyl-sn-glycerol-3-phosphate acyltransferase
METTNPLKPEWLAIRALRFLVAWVFMATFWIVVLTIHLLLLKRTSPLFMMHLIRFWGRTTFKILGVPVHVVNTSTLDEVGARVVVCNHQSALDLPWGGVICPPNPVTIGKKEVIWIPILNLLFWALDFIRIDRSNPARAIATLKGVAERIRKGRRSLVVAPEGTRSPDGALLPFKKGAFHIAIEGGLPIHPVVVHGAFEVLPKNRLLPSRGPIYIQFLEPISTQGLPLAEVTSLTKRVEDQIRTTLHQLRLKYPLKLP